jgi:hypothetical protein
MSQEMSVEQLLVWRLAQANVDAPPAPCAARLLELASGWDELRVTDRTRLRFILRPPNLPDA